MRLSSRRYEPFRINQCIGSAGYRLRGAIQDDEVLKMIKSLADMFDGSATRGLERESSQGFVKLGSHDLQRGNHLSKAVGPVIAGNKTPISKLLNELINNLSFASAWT